MRRGGTGGFVDGGTWPQSANGMDIRAPVGPAIGDVKSTRSTPLPERRHGTAGSSCNPQTTRPFLTAVAGYNRSRGAVV